MHFIIYGPEGSGKGTQAEKLAEKLHLPVYTSGDLVRERAQNDQGVVGDACRRALTEGIYVADEDIFTLWKDKLVTSEAKNGFILDGFPRNAHQAQFVISETQKNGYSIDRVIHLALSDEEALQRLQKRKRKLFAGSTISHDSYQRVKKRLEIYRRLEKDLLKFFKEKKMLISVNGQQSKEFVFEEILEKLELDQ